MTRRALLDDAFDPAAVRRVREDLERERLIAEVAVGDLDCAALFPEGVTFDGANFRTPLSAFQLSELQESEEGKGRLVDQRGFEPLTS